MKILRILMICVMCLGAYVQAMSDAPNWEVVQVLKSSEPADNDHIDVYVKDGFIYVSTLQPVTVKVLSIVGQLISEKKLQPGVARLRITARGIYILKAGGSTIRVSI